MDTVLSPVLLALLSLLFFFFKDNHAWEVRGQLAGVIFSFYQVEPREPTELIRLDGKLLYLLGHVICPVCQVLKVLASNSSSDSLWGPL